MARPRPDATLTDEPAVAAARAAAEGIAEPGAVGEHLGVGMDGDRLATHSFVCTARAYRGWRWAVTVARAPRSRKVTICETHLLPGDDAILAPEWLPYAERLAPGDLGAGDDLPYAEADENLTSGAAATGDEDVDRMAMWEPGLGRRRVLSAEGRDAAAQRWYDGSHGPRAQVAEQARAACSSCGYFLPLAGALRAVFGVCANEWSPSDGQVVSLDHGCGAHSETDTWRREPAGVVAPRLDDLAYDVV